MKPWAILVALAVWLGGCVASVHSPTLTAVSQIDLIRQSDLEASNYIIAGADHTKELKNTLAWCQHRFIVVSFPDEVVQNKHVYLGYSFYRPSGWEILVASDVPENTQLYTLFHELAHTFQARNLTYEASEVFAELAAYQVATNIGMKVRPQAAAYLNTVGPMNYEWQAALSFYREVDTVVMMLTAAAKGQN
jgi:hypothetical protein